MSAIFMALDAIREKKGRSFLTMLGIIIGVCAVLVLVSMVSGYNADLTAYYEKLGVNKVEVALTYYDTGRSPDYTGALYAYGNNDLGDMVTGVTPAQTAAATLKYRVSNLSTTIYFGGDQFSVCNNYTLATGRDLSPLDAEQRSQVCVLGTYTAKALFGYADPLGKTVQLDGVPFTVVGTYYQKDGSAEGSMDDMAAVPYTTSRTLLGSDVVTSYVVKVGKGDDMTAVMSRLEAFFTQELSDTVGEYTLTNGNAAMTETSDETASLSVVLGGIAAIALLVGGIGIMNIMLVTVTERTREIGVKKAIGAPRREVVVQFLVEAGVLSALGGLIGVGLGFALSLVLGKAFYGLILLPSAFVSIGAFAFSVVIGVGFGLYPAVKASGLQPVEALRAE